METCTVLLLLFKKSCYMQKRKESFCIAGCKISSNDGSLLTFALRRSASSEGEEIGDGDEVLLIRYSIKVAVLSLQIWALLMAMRLL